MVDREDEETVGALERGYIPSGTAGGDDKRIKYHVRRSDIRLVSAQSDGLFRITDLLKHQSRISEFKGSSLSFCNGLRL